MNFIDLAKILNSEDETIEYLKKTGILKTFSQCIHCESVQISKIRRGNIKCYTCKREWSSKKYSIIEDIHISSEKFLLALKCFSLKITTSISAYECGITEVTIIKLYSMFRERIANLHEKEISEQKIIVLNIGFDDKNKSFDLQLANDKFTNPKATITLRRIRRKDSGYTYKIEETKHLTTLSSSMVGKVSNIFKDLKALLEKLNARSTKELLKVTGEMVFRYNHKNEDIFEQMLLNIRS